MDTIWESITDWLKEILVDGIIANLSGMFDSTNQQVSQIVGDVGLTPQAWNSGIFNMIQNLSNTIIPFVDNFPRDTELYRIMTTKPQEVKEES